MTILRNKLNNFLKHISPVSVYRFEQEIEIFAQIRKKLDLLEDTYGEETKLVCQSLDDHKRQLDSSEILAVHIQSIQNKLDRLMSTTEGLNNIQRIIHRRSDRLESCMIHCIPRANLSFEIALAEHCNLNCAGCDHFSPLAKPECADLESTARDFARLSELFHGCVEEIHLLGGEPLLNPGLIAFFKMARKYFPDAVIDITTNGLLLLNQADDFWLACRSNNIAIRLTKYPVPLDFERIEECAVKFDVKFRYFGKTGTTIKTTNHYKLDINGQQNGNRNFLLCHRANTCIYLQHGRLYTCTVAPTIRHFNQYFGADLKASPEDSIDIYKANSAEEVMKFLAKPIPFCRYCMIDKTEWNQPWHQSEKAIEEWT